MATKKPVMRDVSELSPGDLALGDEIGRGVRIVVADDERDTVMTLGILLRSSGFDVQLVQRGVDVAAAVAEAQPHAVLLDIAMPDRSGYDVARDLRSRYAERCPILIAVTSYTDASHRAQAEAIGFHHYLPKPYAPLELMRILSELRHAAFSG